MFTKPDSKHTRSRHKIRAQPEQETFGVVNRRQFGAHYIPVIYAGTAPSAIFDFPQFNAFSRMRGRFFALLVSNALRQNGGFLPVIFLGRTTCTHRPCQKIIKEWIRCHKKDTTEVAREATELVH